MGMARLNIATNPDKALSTADLVVEAVTENLDLKKKLFTGIAQVGAQTGHKVTLVDVSQDVLDKSQARINESIKRVAKKKFKEDPTAGEKFISEAVGRLSIAT